MNGEFIVAVHALVYLRHRKECLSSRELAENICTNPVCVRRVMAKLEKAGLAEVRRGGSGGGYCASAERRVTLREIADALGVRFAETDWRSGSPEKNCCIASGMAGFMDDLFASMDEACRSRLETITTEDVEKELIRRQQETASHGAGGTKGAERK